MQRTSARLALPIAIALATLACRADPVPKDLPPFRDRPATAIGPVASNAQEAWPDRPAGMPPLSAKQIAQACVRFAECLFPDGYSMVSLQFVLLFCVGDAAVSAELAVPLSLFTPRSERAEFFVKCALEATDCAAVQSCVTARPENIECDSDGCKLVAGGPYDVSCKGDTATLKHGFETLQRDCSRAFAQCSPQSQTGCTDRTLSVCDPVSRQRGSHCDGNIRLACDVSSQVRYHDCAALGGTCVEEDDKARCDYGPPDARCINGVQALPQCVGQAMTLCVNETRISVDSPKLCST